MAHSRELVEIYLEIGEKHIFAGALNWPGWCRSGRDEDSALQALLDYAPRYAKAIQTAGLGFQAPTELKLLKVVERSPGDTTTDFGAPSAIPSADRKPVDEAELRRLIAITQACWQAFDATVAAAAGKELRKGPRGGGRDVQGIVEHVLGAEQGYLSRVGWKRDKAEKGREPDLTRQNVLEALAYAASGEMPARGPRGGVYWPARYFTRRGAWHILDHLWEIEDRLLPGGEEY